jgi:hypothetical protein
MGTPRQPPDRRPSWGSRRLACRRRRRPPRPPTNRSRTPTSGVHPLATEPRPSGCPMQPRSRCRCRETPAWWNPSRPPTRTPTSHATNTHRSSGFPARAPLMSTSDSSTDVGDQRLRIAASPREQLSAHHRFEHGGALRLEARLRRTVERRLSGALRFVGCRGRTRPQAGLDHCRWAGHARDERTT